MIKAVLIILFAASFGLFLYAADFGEKSYTLQFKTPSSEEKLFVFSENENSEKDATQEQKLKEEDAPEAKSSYKKNTDIEAQTPLSNPPKTIKALYATGWSGGNSLKMDYLVNIAKTTEINAIVVDIKDFSGYVLYNTELELPKKYNAVEVRIPKLNSLIKRLHDEGIYAIARVSVFQDPRLALARPELALQSSSTKKNWLDNKGLAWIDPAAKEAWDYNIAIAKEALERGFDEINFDYIRFASDGNLNDILYPLWDGKSFKNAVIESFFKYLRSELSGAIISADLFGLVTVNNDDLGIGQHLEDAFPYFDYIAPMVYPSHYFTGFMGLQSPAKYPYEVIKYSMDFALNRLNNFRNKILAQNSSTTTPPSIFDPEKLAKFRPWLQDFDLGADYNETMVKREIQAVYDSATTTGVAEINGWMLWNASNVYTKGALENESNN